MSSSYEYPAFLNRLHDFFPPLGEIEMRIYKSRREAGLPVFRDLIEFTETINAFSLRVVERYKAKQVMEKHYEELVHISGLASDLQNALNALPHSLLAKLDVSHKEFFSEFIRASEGAEFLDEFYSHRRGASKLCNLGELHFLSLAASKLAPLRARGRAKSLFQNSVAEEFVIICHQKGWSPVTFSNCGVESMHGFKDAHAVLMLAAIFECCGEPPIRCLSWARTALKSLRGKKWIFCYDSDFYDDFYCQFEVGLTGMLNDSDRLIAKLPRFEPKA